VLAFRAYLAHRMLLDFSEQFGVLVLLNA